MNIHKCKLCNYSTSVATNIKKHMNRKTPCNKVNLTTQNFIKFQCMYCLKIFSRKNNVTKHQLKSCKKMNYSNEEEVEFIYVSDNEEKDLDIIKKIEEELKNKNILLESKLLELENKYNMIVEEKKEWREKEEKLLDKITNAALSKTNTVKNNININTYTRTDEELKNIYEKNLTPLHIEGGISAIAKLIVDKVVTDDNGVKMITITDKSRGTARYKLPSGEDVVDNGLNIFTTKNRYILMKRICSMAASDTSISEQILDVDTTISKGYTQISDDIEGDVLRSNLIKSI